MSLVTRGSVRYGISEEKATEKVVVQFTGVGVDPLGGLSNEQRSRILKAALDAIIANLPTGGSYVFAAGDEVSEARVQVSPTA
ncbi:hypothetical protein [Streptomyces sp. NPDC048057]|uniref:hypothetical protein n=1 Tax=Streptomyces sp. NPDC048057 TaxID=3155628 RepID=UPI0034004376